MTEADKKTTKLFVCFATLFVCIAQVSYIVCILKSTKCLVRYWRGIVIKFNLVKRQYGLLSLFVIAHFSHHLLTSLLAPLTPFIRDDFALDYTKMGLLLTAFSVPYGISQLPAGWLADRISHRLLMVIGISGVALFGFLVGASQTYVMMVVFLVLMGVAGGGYHPASAPLVSELAGQKNRGRVLGLHQIGGSASYFLTPLIAASIATIWGWRSPYVGLAVLTMVFGIVFYMLVGRQMDTKGTGHRPSGSQTDITPASGYLRNLAPFIILSTFTGAVAFSISSFIPLFMVDRFGISKELAAVFLALLYSSGLWAPPLGGYLSDKFGRVRMMLLVGFIAGPVIYLLNLAPYSLGIGGVLVAIGIIAFVRMPVSEAYIVSHTLKHHRSTILGTYYFLALEGSGLLAPVIGYLIDRFGFYASFTIVSAALVIVTLGCSIFLWRSRD